MRQTTALSLQHMKVEVPISLPEPEYKYTMTKPYMSKRTNKVEKFEKKIAFLAIKSFCKYLKHYTKKNEKKYNNFLVEARFVN